MVGQNLERSLGPGSEEVHSLKELYPFQKIGAGFHAGREHSGNADEMGLGKTIQAIETINLTKPDRVLIITPATIKINWERELREWLTHPLDVGIVSGGVWVDKPITIINYDILSRHIAKIHAKSWDMVIVDEAHYIKNLKSLRTAAVLGIPAGKKLWLTGTPILNRPSELLPLLYYIGALDETKFNKYLTRYCNRQLRRGHGGRQYWDDSGSANLDELANNFAPWIIRRTKEEVLPDLPKKRRQIIELDGTEGASSAGVKWLSKFRRIEEEATSLESYRRALRGFEAGFELEFGEISTLRREHGMAKVQSVISFVRNAIEASDKVVLFAHHRDFISTIRLAFGKQCVAVVGGMATGEKQAAVDRFIADPGVALFVGNIEASGVGVDGLQKVASHIIFGELDWVPGRITQAEDRCHRIGQRDSVLIQHLVANNTLDVVMANLVVAKQYIIERIVKGGLKSQAKLSKPSIGGIYEVDNCV